MSNKQQNRKPYEAIEHLFHFIGEPLITGIVNITNMTKASSLIKV